MYKGNVITIASIKSIPTCLDLAIFTTNPLAEEAPDPVSPAEGAGEGAAEGEVRETVLVAPPPGPDRLHMEISDPTDVPYTITITKIFPLSGGHSIPKSYPVAVATVVSHKENTEAPAISLV